MTKRASRFTPDEVLGQRLRAARVAVNKPQTDAAAHVGVVVHTVVNWEHGRTKIPATALGALAGLYGTTPNALLGDL